LLRQLLESVTGFFLPRTQSIVVSERRLQVRVRCHIKVIVEHKGEQLHGLVMDMGHKGLRLRLNVALPKGISYPVRANLGQGKVPPVNLTVLWSKAKKDKSGFLHGLSYDAGEAGVRRSWVGALLRELGLQEKHATSRRKYLRVDGRIPVQFLPEADQLEKPQAIEMVNVGVGGLLVRGKRHIAPGTVARVSLGPWEGLGAAGPFRVQVINAKADETGLWCLMALRFQEVDNHVLQQVGRYVVRLLQNNS
jgi:hypothetical protein